MFDGLKRLEQLINSGVQRAGAQARAVVAQVNPADRGENYNTVMYRQHQQQAPAPQQYAYKPAGQKTWEDDALVNTSKGTVMPLNQVQGNTEWQNPSNGFSPTGYISPSYQAAADGWARKNRTNIRPLF